jgi:carboxyl-terminal processing protease
VNVVDMPLSKAISMIRGPKGKVVTLHILRGGINGRLSIIKIKRDKIQISDAAARGRLFEIDREGKKEKVGVVYLPSFYYHRGDKSKNEATKSCADDVKKVIEDLKDQGMDSLIVDLRDNGGGSLSEVVKMTGFFIDEGPVVQVRDHRGKIDVDEDEDGGVLFDGPLTVMVNQHSASASEIFAAAIQDYERGVIVGTADRTHGKGTVQHVYPLNRIRAMASLEAGGFNPGELKFTVAKFYRVNGGSTQTRGVIPDIALPHYYDKEEQGESSLRYHLGYDTIPSADIDKEDSILEHLKKLQLNSFARIQKNKDYDKFLGVLAYYRDRYSRKEVSLSEPTRKADFVAHREYQKTIKPLMRRLSGKPEVDEDDDSEEDAGLGVFSMADKDDILLDIYLNEAVNIALDLKSLTD